MTLIAHPCKHWQEQGQKKWVDPDQLEDLCDAVREQGKTIATVNGSFDLLHAGHLEILYQASLTADIFIVALNTDASIQQYKSPDRPIIDLENRLLMISALGFVDYVTWFSETDPKALLTKIRPNVHCNGSEYGTDCIEKETVEQHGGTLSVIDLIPGISTSQIITKIQLLCD